MTKLTLALGILFCLPTLANSPRGARTTAARPPVTALCPATQSIAGKCIGVAPQTQCNPTSALTCDPPLQVKTSGTGGCASGFSCTFRACCK